MPQQIHGAFRGVRQTEKVRWRTGLTALLLISLPFILGGGCDTDDLRAAKKLTYPRDMDFEAVYINQDPEWTVTLWEGAGPAPAGKELKPGAWRTEAFRLHFDRPFEIRTLTFSAQAHDRTEASETLQIRPADQPRMGIVFSRTAEGDPDIHWLSNPESINGSKAGRQPKG